jgi:hypothetical protein
MALEITKERGIPSKKGTWPFVKEARQDSWIVL